MHEDERSQESSSRKLSCADMSNFVALSHLLNFVTFRPDAARNQGAPLS